MSTTTCNPDGSLTMTPAKLLLCEVVNIVAVKNGWMLFEHEQRFDVVYRPSFVFNNIDEMLAQVKKLLVANECKL